MWITACILLAQTLYLPAFLKIGNKRGAWLAQAVEHVTADLKVVSSGMEPTSTEKKNVF